MSRRLQYTFRLSDQEFRRAWLAEYYRRPGWRVIRVAAAPALVAMGVSMLRIERATNAALYTALGWLTIAYGIYYAIKPFLRAHVLVRERQKQNAAARELTLSLDESAMEIDDGRMSVRLTWNEVSAAGRGRDYIWYELRSGQRATIPLRAVQDEEQLVALLSAKAEWMA